MNYSYSINEMVLLQKLLCETTAPVHQHLGDEHQRSHRCRGGTSSYAEGLYLPKTAHRDV